LHVNALDLSEVKGVPSFPNENVRVFLGKKNEGLENLLIIRVLSFREKHHVFRKYHVFRK